MTASALSIGDLGIIGYNTGQTEESPNTTDRIHFVLLAPIGSGTTIYFTDRSWNGTVFAAAGGGEGTFAYTAATDLPAGTVIEITQANLTAAGITLSESGEAIYAYQGTGADAPTQFLFALEIADGNSTFNASLVNTGLTNGVNAVSVAHDSGAYHGPTTHAESFLWNGAGTSLLHSIADATNWVGDDFAAGDNSKEQEVQTGSWLVHADTEFWGTMAGGGGGFANTLGDATFASGGDDFNHTRIHDSGSSSNGAIVGQFWSLRDMVFDTVDGKFFVVDSDISGGHNRILQGNISDLIANPTSLPALTVLYSDTGTTTASRLDNLEVDVANNIIYFTHGSQLLKLNYNTAGQAGTVLFDANAQGAVTATTGNPAGSTNNFFNDMVIDFAADGSGSGRIYISSTRVLAGASGDAVSKNFIYELTGLTTSSGANAFTMQGTNNTGSARLLPFVENDDAFNPNAGTTASPATTSSDDFFWAVERGTIDGLAIDPVSNTLYFSTGEILFDHDLNSGTAALYAGGVVASYALDGNPTGAATILYQQTAQFGGAIPGLMGDLEIDLVTGHLYVLDYNGINGVNDDNHWFRMTTSASTPTQFTQTIGDIEGAATVGLTLNHAPTLSGAAAGGLAVTEASSAPNSGETARVTLFSGVTIADPDTSTADEITGAVVRIGDGFTFEASSTAGGHTGTIDYLRINGTTSGTIAGSGIAYTYNQTTGAMVLTGAATVAEYKAAIELVQFSTSGDNVTNNGNATSRTIHVSVSDGLTMSDEISATVNVTGINDAPVNTPGVAMNFTEDTTGSTGGTPPVNAITGISIADADADATTENFTVTLTVNTGTLTIRTDVTGGLVAGDVVGNGTASLTLTGTQNEINATLAAVNGSAQANGLVYTPPANFNGAATLTIVTNDQGNNGNDPGSTGTGTTEQDSDTKTLNVADVNDAPTIGDGTEAAPTILEDTPATDATAATVATLFGGQFADAADVQFHAVDNPTGSPGDTFAGIAIVADGSNADGQWEYWTGAAWADIGSASLTTARTFSASTQLRFNPALNFNGTAPTLTVHLIETGGAAITNNGTVNLTGATGGTTVYSASTVVLSQAVTAVNDAPVNAVGATVNINEDATNVVLSTTGSAMSVSDVEATGDINYTLAVTNGVLTIRTDVAGGIEASDITVGPGTGNGTSSIIITATVAQINATLAASNALLYTPTANYNGTDTLAVYANDLGQTGTDPNPATVLPDITVGPVTEEDYDERTINIASVNDEPAGGDETVVLNEDATYTFTTAAFGFSDPNDGDALLEVVITTLPTDGTLYLNGVAITVASTAISATDIGNSLLTYEPDADENGTGYASFTFQVRDVGGTANGGQNTDQSPNTFTFDVTAVNDAPTSTNLSGNNVVWTEGDATVVLDSGGDATLADIDSANFAGGSLTVSISGGAVAVEDQLRITAAGTVTFDATTVSVGGTQIGTYTGGGAGGGDLVFTLDADATAAAVQELLRAIGYTNTGGDDPTDGDRTVTWTLVDGDGTANGGVETLQFTSTVDVDPVDDAPVAQADAVTTAENVVLTGGVGALFANNGSGIDADVDGPALSIAEVNGNAANVDTQITLASGALLTVNADGSYSYDPNGKFNHQVSSATAAATGAVNDSGPDTFTYMLTGGNTVTVTITVTGVDGSGDELRGDAGVNTITGTGAADLINLSQGGEDNATGGAGNDGFYMGAALTAADNLDGQGGTNDQLGLQGNYGSPFVFGASNLVGMEALVLLPGNDTRFGDTAGNLYSYDLATIDANVGAGQTLIVNFNTLQVGENVTFNGSAELDGSFLTFGGLGNDAITGGQQSDGFYFGFPNRWSTGDSVDGQGGTDDQLGLQGNYSGASAVVFGAGQITSIETLVLLTGGDARFGSPPGEGYSYDITMDDDNVGLGQTMTVNANTLRANVVGVTDETLTFDGSAELDGNFIVYGGAGADTIVGGAGSDQIYGAGGADTMTGGAGNDEFAYMNAAHSTSAVRDTITDFTVGDLIDLFAIDANTLAGGDQAFSFIGSLAFAGTGAASAGELRAASAGGANWLVQGDTDGNGVADFELFLTVSDADPITSFDFVL